MLEYAGFVHLMPLQIRWGDMDALGHVNNAVYLTYFEQARVNYFAVLKLWDGGMQRFGAIVARAAIDYKLPLFVEPNIYVATRCARLGNRSFDIEQHLFRHKDEGDTLVAQAMITVVSFDYEANTSISIPQHWRDTVKAYETTPITE